MNSVQYAYTEIMASSPTKSVVSDLIIQYAFSHDPAIHYNFKKVLYRYRKHTTDFNVHGPEVFHLCAWLSLHKRVNVNFDRIWDILHDAYHSCVVLMGYTPDIREHRPLTRHACARYRKVLTVSELPCFMTSIAYDDILLDVGDNLSHFTLELSFKGVLDLESVIHSLPSGYVIVAPTADGFDRLLCDDGTIGWCGSLLIGGLRAVYVPVTETASAIVKDFLYSDHADFFNISETVDPLSQVPHYCVELSFK